jgi:hypothetical protein
MMIIRINYIKINLKPLWFVLSNDDIFVIDSRIRYRSRGWGGPSLGIQTIKWHQIEVREYGSKDWRCVYIYICIYVCIYMYLFIDVCPYTNLYIYI